MSSEYSIVIPVLRMESSPYLQDILTSLSKQSVTPTDVHIVVGDRRQGRAINYGISKVKTEYVGTVDDDTEIDDTELFSKLLKALNEDDTIGMAGTACLISKHASNFQKKAMRQIPRRFFPVQKEHLDSDMVQHPCLLMKKALFDEIEGEDEQLIRGLDPVLRKKVRDAGKRVTIIADTWIYHLIPDGFWEVMKMYYRNGRGSGFASKNYPHRIIELTDGYDGGKFVQKRPLWQRILRRIYITMADLVKLNIIAFSANIAYTIGVIKEKIHTDYVLEPPEIEKIEMTTEDKYPFKLHIHEVKLKDSVRV